MPHFTLEVTLTLIGPILTRSTSARASGVDAPMAQTADGRYYLPYSLVRGRLRQSWEELNRVRSRKVDTDDYLGPSYAEENPLGYSPRRARLRFYDFLYEPDQPEPAKEPDLAFRIRIDPERGAVSKGAMLVLECPFGPGKEFSFHGRITFDALDEATASKIREDIILGLRWVTSLGAERTTGFGRLAKVLATELAEDIPPPAQPGSGSGDQRFGVIVRFEQPFCVARRAPIGNLFESDEILSGGVFKGAVASALAVAAGRSRGTTIDGTLPSPWTALGEHFHLVRFTHAFPAPDASLIRPVVAPLSLVKPSAEIAGGRPWYDVALCAGPVLLGNPGTEAAPTFAIDWKDHDDVQADFGWGRSRPGRELRVRTAIDRDRRRAKDQQLFAYEMVVPAGFVWLARLDLSRITDAATRVTVADSLRKLLAPGLSGIGKTKANAQLEIIPDANLPAHLPSACDPIGNLWIVTLQTPALLCDPARLNETSGERDLRAAYEAAWSTLSGDTVELVRFFASQTLVGGYLVERFQEGKAYNPFLLTDPGSVFVLRAKDGQAGPAQAHIARWQETGLAGNGSCLPQWAAERYGDDWNSCPFRTVDGFGEVVVNLACHRTTQPQETPFHVLA